MSTNSYTTVDELRRRHQKVIETLGLTPTEIEPHINDAEAEINGAVARRYSVPFSVGLYPLEPIRTITRLLGAHYLLRSYIIQEDPSRSDWVEKLRERGQQLLDGVADGKLDVVAYADNAGSAFVVGRRARTQDVVYSSTSTYVPTMDHRDAIRQEVDQDRLDDEENRALKR